MAIPKSVKQTIINHFVLDNMSVGAIATLCQVHHKTVKRCLDEYYKHSTGKSGSLHGEQRFKKSIIIPFIPFIQSTYSRFETITASRLYQMVKERGYTGGPDHFRHQLVTLGLKPKKTPEAFLRLKTLPGEQAQVDWAEVGRIVIDNKEHKLFVFIMVLSYSRRPFYLFTPNMHFDNFLLGHINAFDEWQGVPRVIYCDNLKSAVTERYQKLINFNDKYLEFAAHYHFLSNPVGVRKGNEKGKVERAVRYLRSSFLMGREITTLETLNQEVKVWCEEYAMQRRWAEMDSMSVAEAFEKESGVLQPLPDHPLTPVKITQSKVDTTAHIRFETNDYTVPPEYVKKSVLVYASKDQIDIHYEHHVIATHQRCYGHKRVIQNPEHIEAIRQYKRAGQEGSLLYELNAQLPSLEIFLTSALKEGISVNKQVKGIRHLIKRYGIPPVENALQQAISLQAYSYQTVEHIINNTHEALGKTPIIDNRHAQNLRGTLKDPGKTVEALQINKAQLVRYDNLMK